METGSGRKDGIRKLPNPLVFNLSHLVQAHDFLRNIQVTSLELKKVTSLTFSEVQTKCKQNKFNLLTFWELEAPDLTYVVISFFIVIIIIIVNY